MYEEMKTGALTVSAIPHEFCDDEKNEGPLAMPRCRNTNTNTKHKQDKAFAFTAFVWGCPVSFLHNVRLS